MAPRQKKHNFLSGARVYLSGPMDFVASREIERKSGWRVRARQFLEAYGVRVFDPWTKPDVRGLLEYGREDLTTLKQRDRWTFADNRRGAQERGELNEYFWPTMHIDLRMVDVSDFVIAYCPASIYSVGTVHEIVVAREQHKPVLLVSPPIEFPALRELEDAVQGDERLCKVVDRLRTELPAKENPNGAPSLWYMALIGSESFFDGFGFRFAKSRRRFPSWREPNPLDDREGERRPKRPLIPFLEKLADGKSVPRRWSCSEGKYVQDDDWLLLEHSIA